MKHTPWAELPFGEYEHRIQRARKLMEASHLDAMLLFHHQNVYYFSGYRRTVSTAKVEGVLVLADRPPVMLVPQLTSRYCEKAVWTDDIRIYGGAPHLNHPLNITDLVIQTFRERRLASGRIALELSGEIYPDISFNELSNIMKAFPSATFMDASPLIWEQRKIKSAFEQDIMRTVGRIALKGFQEGIKALREGTTEAELSRIIWNSWMQEGIADTPMEGQLLIRTGSRGEGPQGRYPCSHARPADYPIRRGETVLLDAGPSYRGYFADLMRQASMGPPSEILKKLFETAVAGYRKGLEMLKPGVAISELTKESIAAMQKYNPRIKYPLSFVGHSIGLTIHEPPWFSVNEESILEPGMVINFEIGAYDIPEWRTLGGFLEDMFIVTETGYENLTEEGCMTLAIVE